MDIEIILDPNLTPDQIAELAVVAENGGVRTLWHSNLYSAWDAFIALVPAAMATSRIRLGVLAVSPYEMHPLKISNAILSLNEIANGRAIIAIGGGGAVISATSAEGVRLNPKKMRIVRGVREAVEIVKAAYSGELIKPYKGELFQITLPVRTDWAKSDLKNYDFLVGQIVEVRRGRGYIDVSSLNKNDLVDLWDFSSHEADQSLRFIDHLQIGDSHLKGETANYLTDKYSLKGRFCGYLSKQLEPMITTEMLADYERA